MIKNIKRFKKDMEKEGNPIAEKDENGAQIYMDIVPFTYQLPSEYNIFVEEFKKYKDAIWIVKPISGAQGKGIYLMNNLNSIKRFDNRNMKDPHVVSRFINSPLLLGQKKFDLRIYVLVTSYKPLKVWLTE